MRDLVSNTAYTLYIHRVCEIWDEIIFEGALLFSIQLLRFHEIGLYTLRSNIMRRPRKNAKISQFYMTLLSKFKKIGKIFLKSRSLLRISKL